jgi:hypothetical protein
VDLKTAVLNLSHIGQIGKRNLGPQLSSNAWRVDCGIFLMMFLEHWTSPRSLLTQIFSVSDVPRIRIKIANELMFVPANTWLKRLVISFREEV